MLKSILFIFIFGPFGPSKFLEKIIKKSCV